METSGEVGREGDRVGEFKADGEKTNIRIGRPVGKQEMLRSTEKRVASKTCRCSDRGVLRNTWEAGDAEGFKGQKHWKERQNEAK